MEVDLSTKHKLSDFLDRKTRDAEVIALFQAHCRATTVPMTRLVCKNIDDLLRTVGTLDSAAPQLGLARRRAETA
jgi:hypothetical protein